MLRLENRDCLEVLKTFPDSSIDVVITDPPYGVRKEEEWDNAENFDEKIDIWLNECLRVAKNGVIWFCSGNMLPRILKNHVDTYQRILVWNKPKGSQYAGAQHNGIWYSSEIILVFKKNDELLKRGGAERMTYSVFDHRTIASAEFDHPTTKPLDLMEKLVKHYSARGETILDPFMGSGTTGVAALRLERGFIGCELDPKHFKTAEKRIGDWGKQARLG